MKVIKQIIIIYSIAALIIFMMAPVVNYWIDHFNPKFIIGCSHRINENWFIKIPDINSSCPEYATHWKIYGERIKN